MYRKGFFITVVLFALFLTLSAVALAVSNPHSVPAESVDISSSATSNPIFNNPTKFGYLILAGTEEADRFCVDNGYSGGSVDYTYTYYGLPPQTFSYVLDGEWLTKTDYTVYYISQVEC